ncbi:hypothetical protein [Undibacterium sp.]|jgi:toxin CptA|uniref:hypothetical protein n=1 Tax=Undibacterium sp. TaxID=1914977 RepID=UPI002B9A1031|nr:hypothetical protein [Undibacterium sp.]HTD02893.1 hypothetical protein [Undibacterium sp.]
MSIAISANIVPSRSLLLIVCAMCALACMAGMYAASSPDLHRWLRLPVLLLGLLCPAWAFLRFLQTRLPARLDISATGEIILRKSAAPPLGFPFKSRSHLDRQYSFAVNLAENATLWPNLLLLNLREDDGTLHILPILWDSVQPATFKALSVAFRWIAVAGPQKGDFL